MYSVNGIDLQSSEYAELKMLVETEDAGGDLELAAFASLCPTGEKQEFDERKCEVYRGLKRMGLISGMNAPDGFYFYRLNQKGIDFVKDLALQEEQAHERTKQQRSHDAKMVLIGVCAGGVLGFAAGIAGYVAARALGL